METIGPKALAMLDRVAKAEGRLLAISILAAGGGEPAIYRKLLRTGLIEETDHPTVKTGRHRDQPALAVKITDEGREVLNANRSKTKAA